MTLLEICILLLGFAACSAGATWFVFDVLKTINNYEQAMQEQCPSEEEEVDE